MWDLSKPDAVRSITMAGHTKVWHIEPGTVVVDGEIIRFRLARSGMLVQLHREELGCVVSEGAE